MKKRLTPFDAECIKMIADLTKVEPQVEQHGNSFTVAITLGTVPGEIITALHDAIKGRFGSRLIFHEEKDGQKVYTVGYDPEGDTLPDTLGGEVVEIDPEAGTRYCRTLKEVNAIQVDRENVPELQRFTGGGSMSIPRIPGGIGIYSFITQNGLSMDVPETWYIIREDNGTFSKRPKREFDAEFEPKGIRTVGNYDRKPQPTAKDKAVDVVHNISPGLRYMVDERLEQLFKGRTVEHDNKENAAGELLDVAAALVKNDPDLFGRSGWSWDWWEKTTAKSEKERLAIAGALIAAEIDREEINRVAYENEIAARNDNNK